MAITLFNADEDGKLSENYAEFGNSAIPAHDKGECSWDNPTYNEEAERWEIPNFAGKNAQGTAFNAGTLVNIPEAKTVTPADVFWWAAEVIKSTLCPSCM